MYEPVDVIDVDEPVWIVLRSTAEPTATTQSTSYIAHSSILPRSALSVTQARGTPPAAHTTATLPMQSQYLHPSPLIQTVVADIHRPPASFADTPVSTSTNVPATPVPASFPLVELLPPIPTRVTDISQARPTLTAETLCVCLLLHHIQHTVIHRLHLSHILFHHCTLSSHTYTFAHLYWSAYRC